MLGAWLVSSSPLAHLLNDFYGRLVDARVAQPHGALAASNPSLDATGLESLLHDSTTHLHNHLPRPGSATEQACPNCTWHEPWQGMACNPSPLLLLLAQPC